MIIISFSTKLYVTFKDKLHNELKRQRKRVFFQFTQLPNIYG